MLKLLRSNWISLSYLVLVAILLLLAFYIPREQQFKPVIMVQNPAEAALKVIDKLATLAAGLSTAFVAATVGIAIKGNDIINDKSPLSMIAVVLIFLSAAASYFGIYLGYVRLISMISTAGVSSIDPAETQMLWAVRLQFWGIVSEAIALGFLLVRILEGKSRTS